MWKEVPWTDGIYEVSDDGRVRNVTRKELKPQKSRGRYRRVNISMNGHRRLHQIHRIVALVFIGPCPHGYQVNHIDSDPSNNSATNLEYVTAKGNQEHSWRTTDRQPPHKGERTHFAKLTDTDVIRIRSMRKEGMTYKDIASHFRTKPANVWHICVGHTWKHLL